MQGFKRNDPVLREETTKSIIQLFFQSTKITPPPGWDYRLVIVIEYIVHCIYIWIQLVTFLADKILTICYARITSAYDEFKQCRNYTSMDEKEDPQ